MVKNKLLCDKFDLGSVTTIFTGAAPLGGETAENMQKQHPEWNIRQGYGMFQLLWFRPCLLISYTF